MKRLSLFLIISFFSFHVSLSYADTYPPIVGTFHDAYLYYLDKSKDSKKSGYIKEMRRYYQLARIYAGSTEELKHVSDLMGEHMSQEQVKNFQDIVLAEPVSETKPKETQHKEIMEKKMEAIVSSDAGVPQVLKNLVDKQTITIPLGKTVIIERNGIKRFAVVDEGFVTLKKEGQDQMYIKAIKRGSTFMNIWDESGRLTLYIKIIFLQQAIEAVQAHEVTVEHNRPFKFSYSNDWSAYYSDEKLKNLRRGNLSFLQNIAVDGPTPFADIDSYMTFDGFENRHNIQSYTLGLSSVPINGTKHTNIRFFDTPRSLSPLTLSASHLRGIFIDTDILDDMLRVSYSHGRVRPAFGFLGFGSSGKLDSFVDAGKITLFPHDIKKQYALNVVTGNGNDRNPDVAKKAISLQGIQKINKATLNGEVARNNDNRNAYVLGSRYDGQNFTTELNFRNINKNYTTVLNPASNQGEIGATWSNSFYNQKFDAQTMVDVYQDRLYFNPEKEDALNIDSNVRFHMPFNADVWTDANLFFLNAPGEITPRKNFGIDDRISYSFNAWNKRRAIVYAGVAYQLSRYENTPQSAYDRLTAIVGARWSLTQGLSLSSKYEMSYVHEPFTNNNYRPGVFDIGLNYYHDFAKKWVGNWGLNYRRESGVRGSNSFLSGEDSIDGSLGLTYNPVTDTSIFFDTRLRRVMPKSEEVSSYYSLDVRFGLRTMFGGGVHFDPTGRIYGHVFNDANGNGLKEKGEQGLGNVMVKVGDQQVTTDANGYYSKNYSAKAVMVRPDAQTIPSGFVFSSKDQIRVPIEQWSSAEVNFGVTAHSSAYGIIYIDKNNNQQPDEGDQFLPRIRFVLDGKDEQYSDNRGAYYFRNIEVGRHAIQLDLGTVPIEMVPLVKVKEEFNVGQGVTYTKHFPLRIKESP